MVRSSQIHPWGCERAHQPSRGICPVDGCHAQLTQTLTAIRGHQGGHRGPHPAFKQSVNTAMANGD